MMPKPGAVVFSDRQDVLDTGHVPRGITQSTCPYRQFLESGYCPGHHIENKSCQSDAALMSLTP